MDSTVNVPFVNEGQQSPPSKSHFMPNKNKPRFDKRKTDQDKPGSPYRDCNLGKPHLRFLIQCTIPVLWSNMATNRPDSSLHHQSRSQKCSSLKWHWNQFMHVRKNWNRFCQSNCLDYRLRLHSAVFSHWILNPSSQRSFLPATDLWLSHCSDKCHKVFLLRKSCCNNRQDQSCTFRYSTHRRRCRRHILPSPVLASFRLDPFLNEYKYCVFVRQLLISGLINTLSRLRIFLVQNVDEENGKKDNSKQQQK